MRNFIFWFLAVMITIGAAFFQRVTGPTYPLKTNIEINGVIYKFRFERSQTNTRPCEIKLALPEDISGTVFYKRFTIDEPWVPVIMKRDNNFLTATIPSQPAAAKIQYYIKLTGKSGKEYYVNQQNPVIMRFKGDVPALVMIPHILIMFIAMLFSNIAGLFAASGDSRQKKYGLLTLTFMLAGGMILGPIVQYYAFGQAWTGIPFGWDLTDNKTILAVAFWAVAVVTNRKKENRVWTIAAAIFLLVVYSVPHSLFGSQLDYSSGRVTQGLITFLHLF